MAERIARHTAEHEHLTLDTLQIAKKQHREITERFKSSADQKKLIDILNSDTQTLTKFYDTEIKNLIDLHGKVISFYLTVTQANAHIHQSKTISGRYQTPGSTQYYQQNLKPHENYLESLLKPYNEVLPAWQLERLPENPYQYFGLPDILREISAREALLEKIKDRTKKKSAAHEQALAMTQNAAMLQSMAQDLEQALYALPRLTLFIKNISQFNSLTGINELARTPNGAVIPSPTIALLRKLITYPKQLEALQSQLRHQHYEIAKLANQQSITPPEKKDQLEKIEMLLELSENIAKKLKNRKLQKLLSRAEFLSEQTPAPSKKRILTKEKSEKLAEDLKIQELGLALNEAMPNIVNQVTKEGATHLQKLKETRKFLSEPMSREMLARPTSELKKKLESAKPFVTAYLNFQAFLSEFDGQLTHTYTMLRKLQQLDAGQAEKFLVQTREQPYATLVLKILGLGTSEHNTQTNDATEIAVRNYQMISKTIKQREDEEKNRKEIIKNSAQFIDYHNKNTTFLPEFKSEELPNNASISVLQKYINKHTLYLNELTQTRKTIEGSLTESELHKDQLKKIGETDNAQAINDLTFVWRNDLRNIEDAANSINIRKKKLEAQLQRSIVENLEPYQQDLRNLRFKIKSLDFQLHSLLPKKDQQALSLNELRDIEQQLGDLNEGYKILINKLRHNLENMLEKQREFHELDIRPIELDEHISETKRLLSKTEQSLHVSHSAQTHLIEYCNTFSKQSYEKLLSDVNLELIPKTSQLINQLVRWREYYHLAPEIESHGAWEKLQKQAELQILKITKAIEKLDTISDFVDTQALMDLLTEQKRQLHDLSGHLANSHLMQTTQEPQNWQANISALNKAARDPIQQKHLKKTPEKLLQYRKLNTDFIMQTAAALKRHSQALLIAVNAEELFEKKRHNRPTLSAISDHFNQLARFVAGNILSFKTADERSLQMERWIWILDRTFKQGDFLSFDAIMAGLNNLGIYRLKFTRSLLSPEAQQCFNRYKNEFGSSAQGAKKLQHHSEKDPANIPSMNHYVADMSRLSEATHDLKSHPIAQTLVRNIRNFQDHQRLLPPLTAGGESLLKEIAQTQFSAGEDERLYQQSLHIEPKDFQATRTFKLVENISLPLKMTTEVISDLKLPKVSDIKNNTLLKLIVENKWLLSPTTTAQDIEAINKARLEPVCMNALNKRLSKVGLHLNRQQLKKVQDENKQHFYHQLFVNPIIKKIAQNCRLKTRVEPIFGGRATGDIINSINNAARKPVSDRKLGKLLNAIGIVVDKNTLAQIQVKNYELAHEKNTKLTSRKYRDPFTKIIGTLFKNFANPLSKHVVGALYKKVNAATLSQMKSFKQRKKSLTYGFFKHHRNQKDRSFKSSPVAKSPQLI